MQTLKSVVQYTEQLKLLPYTISRFTVDNRFAEARAAR